MVRHLPAMTLDRRLFLLATLPLLFALAAASVLVLRSHRAVKEMDGLEALSQLVWKMGDVEKCLVAEVDNWYMFRAEHANDPADVLAEARKKQDAARAATDGVFVEYDQLLAEMEKIGIPPEIRSVLDAIAGDRAKLKEVRATLYRTHTDAESADIATYYQTLRTKLGSVLSLLIHQTTDDVVTRKLQVLARTIQLRKESMEAGWKIFWMIQVYNKDQKLIPPELGPVIVRGTELADDNWKQAVALSRGAINDRFNEFEAAGLWTLPIETMRKSADALARGLPPPLQVEEEWSKQFSFISGTLGEFVDVIREDFKSSCSSIREDHIRERNMTLGIVVVGTLLITWGIRRMARRISQPLKETAETMSLTARAFLSQAGELAKASQSISSGASDQAASLEETSASLEELNSSTKHNQETAAAAATISNSAASSAEEGRRLLEELSKTIAEVETSGGAISQILKNIDQIAFPERGRRGSARR